MSSKEILDYEDSLKSKIMDEKIRRIASEFFDDEIRGILTSAIQIEVNYAYQLLITEATIKLEEFSPTRKELILECNGLLDLEHKVIFLCSVFPSPDVIQLSMDVLVDLLSTHTGWKGYYTCRDDLGLPDGAGVIDIWVERQRDTFVVAIPNVSQWYFPKKLKTNLFTKVSWRYKRV